MKYPLPILLKKLRIAKSSYYYQKKRICFAEKRKDDCQVVTVIFRDNKEIYGYRRIKVVLNREGYILSKKLIRRIMRKNGLLVKGGSARKYCSYKGKISPEVPNVIRRNFKADKPNQKWLTNVTEFSIPYGKIYLPSIIDSYDDMPVAWDISFKPNAQSLPHDTHPIFIRCDTAITDGLAGSSGSTLRGSPNPCKVKDACQTIQPVKDFSKE